MAHFGSQYWTARYFPAGYWGFSEDLPGAMSASLSGSGGISASLTSTGILVDDQGVYRGRKKKKPLVEIVTKPIEVNDDEEVIMAVMKEFMRLAA